MAGQGETDFVRRVKQQDPGIQTSCFPAMPVVSPNLGTRGSLPRPRAGHLGERLRGRGLPALPAPPPSFLLVALDKRDLTVRRGDAAGKPGDRRARSCRRGPLAQYCRMRPGSVCSREG